MTEDERRQIEELAAQLTGAAPTGEIRRDSLIANVRRRMDVVGEKSLASYLAYVGAHAREKACLISALSIHTTSWFRENPHFVAFQEYLLRALARQEVFKVWCAACSTGEEVFSFALMLEEFRQVHPEFDYELLGTDVDPLSIETAKRAIYPRRAMNFHLNRYRRHLLEGSGPTEGLFTLSKDIRARCRFETADLRQTKTKISGTFHVIVCRNVLIYFDAAGINRVVGALATFLKPDGRLLLGHSEAVNAASFGLTQEGHSVYAKRGAAPKPAPGPVFETPTEGDAGRPTRKSGKYRLLCVDDSLLTRKYLEKTFRELGFDVVSVGSASEATAHLNFNDVDLITLDLNMPDTGGEKWLVAERRERLKTPVVILSDAHAHEAPAVVSLLALGAQEYIEKSRLAANPEKTRDLFFELIRTSPTAARMVGGRSEGMRRPVVRPELILVGASTGGPQALVELLKSLPDDVPPVVITQHISVKFLKPLAERIAEVAGLKLGRVADFEPLKPGHLYMSQGDYHVGVGLERQMLVLRTSTAPAYNGHRPSVDYLFNSALGVERATLAMLLTGMGRDGALGMRFLHQDGAFCVAQSEQDSIVFGMPREAIERGAVDFVGTIAEIRMLIHGALKLPKKLVA